MRLMVVTDETSQFPMSWLNAEASLNIPSMVVTDETSQPLISSLNELLERNKDDISVTLELKHHSPIGPYVLSISSIIDVELNQVLTMSVS